MARTKKKKLGSYPFASVVFSITLALFVIGIFSFLILYSNTLSEQIRSNVRIQVYLHKFTTESDQLRITKILSSKPYVSSNEEGYAIEYISKEEAAEIFIEDTGEDFVAFLGDNPLRDAFNVGITTPYQQKDSLRHIKADIEEIDGVFEVEYVENFIEEVNANLTKIGLLLLTVSIILLATIVILINNTIKLALFSQRFLIRSMQLVGAKTSFIVLPFLRRSLWHGLLSGLLASALIYALLQYGNSQIENLNLLATMEQIAIVFLSLLLLGSIIAFFSTYRAVNKYLKMSLDELY